LYLRTIDIITTIQILFMVQSLRTHVLALDGVEEAGRRREAATVMPNYKVFSGNSNPDLARDIAHRLGLPDLNNTLPKKQRNEVCVNYPARACTARGKGIGFQSSRNLSDS
jgi:hypothetical protein